MKRGNRVNVITKRKEIKMSKCLNQEEFKEVIERVLKGYKDWHDRQWDFETYAEKNPYGDTWATTSIEITDESQKRCDEDFKGNFDVDDFIHDFLQEDATFREMIEQMVKKEF